MGFLKTQGTEVTSFLKRSGAPLSLFIALSLLLSACLPQSKPDYEIVSAKLGDTQLYIPKEYLKFRHTSVGTESALLQAWYPGAAPVPGDDSTELWRQGIWWKNVRILITFRKDKTIPFDEGSRRGVLRYLKATEFVGEEFGLAHWTQPEGGNQDLHDVWLEPDGDTFVSRITCSEKLTEIDKPNCAHYFFQDAFSVKISYDRRFLPEWRTISSNVTALLDSFRSPEAAKEFLRQQIELAGSAGGDEEVTP